MISKTIACLRRVYSLKKVDFAKLVGISGQYVSRIESGDNKKISETLTKQIVTNFNVSRNWLLEGTINKDRHEYLKGCSILNKLPIVEVSRELAVPEEFIRAIINGELSPSDEFWSKLLAAFNLPDSPNFSSELKTEIEKRKAVANREPNGSSCDGCERLKFELHEAYEALNEKNEEIGEWKGRAKAFEQMYRETVEKLEKATKT
jgi:transcriptional regulator with XRE-family HTH domain